jgi:hypothetical protein
MADVKYALKKTFEFSKKEINLFLLGSVMSGFLVSFRMWGGDKFDFNTGIMNLLVYTCAFILFYALFVCSQKFMASLLGYDCNYDLWKYGPIIGFFITIYLALLFPNAQFVVFLYLGTVHLTVVPRLKLGKYWPGLNVKDLMLVGLIGPLIMVIFMIVILLPPYLATHSDLAKNMLYVAGLIVFFSSLPLPNTNGMNVLLFSRKLWLFYFAFGIFFLWLIWSFTIFAAAIALVLALLFVFVAKKFSEAHLH